MCQTRPGFSLADQSNVGPRSFFLPLSDDYDTRSLVQGFYWLTNQMWAPGVSFFPSPIITTRGHWSRVFISWPIKCGPQEFFSSPLRWLRHEVIGPGFLLADQSNVGPRSFFLPLSDDYDTRSLVQGLYWLTNQMWAPGVFFFPSPMITTRGHCFRVFIGWPIKCGPQEFFLPLSDDNDTRSLVQVFYWLANRNHVVGGLERHKRRPRKGQIEGWLRRWKTKALAASSSTQSSELDHSKRIFFEAT